LLATKINHANCQNGITLLAKKLQQVYKGIKFDVKVSFSAVSGADAPTAGSKKLNFNR